MVVFSKKVYKSNRYKSEFSTKTHLFICFLRILLSLTLCGIISCLPSEELKIDRNRGRVISVNERINDNNYELSPNSRPNWWRKKVERRPTFIVNDEPVGTGVPTWKEIDIYGSDYRKGKSYAYRTENSCFGNRLVPSLVVITALKLCFTLNIC